MNDELRNFFELAFALRNQCEASSDLDKDKALKISALSKACAEVVRYGKIPKKLRIEGDSPIKTDLVESLFKSLDIRIGCIIRSRQVRGRAMVFFATFTLE